LAHQVCEFFDRHLDFENVLAGRVSGGASPVSIVAVAGCDGLPDLAFTLPNLLLATRKMDEAGQIDSIERDRDQVLTLLPDHLAFLHESTQLVAHATAHDLSKAPDIGIDDLRHRLSVPWRRHGQRCWRRSATHR
jgi:hypothetical protein